MEPSDELKEVALSFYRAFSQRDLAAIERMHSRDDGVTAIGTDANEWWTGCEKLMKVFRAQLEEMSGLELVPGDIQAYVEGPWAGPRSAQPL